MIKEKYILQQEQGDCCFYLCFVVLVPALFDTTCNVKMSVWKIRSIYKEVRKKRSEEMESWFQRRKLGFFSRILMG